jgi:hypothetical protein
LQIEAIGFRGQEDHGCIAAMRLIVWPVNEQQRLVRIRMDKETKTERFDWRKDLPSPFNQFETRTYRTEQPNVEE